MERLMGKKRFQEVLGKLVIKPPGKPNLVPVGDKRPAIILNDVKSDFTEVKNNG